MACPLVDALRGLRGLTETSGDVSRLSFPAARFLFGRWFWLYATVTAGHTWRCLLVQATPNRWVAPNRWVRFLQALGRGFGLSYPATLRRRSIARRRAILDAIIGGTTAVVDLPA